MRPAGGLWFVVRGSWLVVICQWSFVIGHLSLAGEDSADVLPVPKEQPAPPPKETPKEPPKETPKEPPKENPTPPPPERPPDPLAETVPLPAKKPDTPAPNAATAKLTADADDLQTLTLTLESAAIAPGEAAVFSLYGPEMFLRNATAEFLLRDEHGRHAARGTLRVQELPFSEDKPRQLKISVAAPLSQQHVFELALTGADGRKAQLTCPLTVAPSEPRNALEPRALASGPLPHGRGSESGWERWIALIATPPPETAEAGETPVVQNGWNALRSIGIRGGVQYRLHPARREALRKGNAPFYVENIARQLLSRYHTERGLWEKTVAAMQSDPNSRAPLMRDPSLCSPAFAEAFARELQRHAETYAKDPPLFYSLASEPSVTRLAAAADFDFSPEAIGEFQRWLERDVYGTLKALNAAWDTRFKTWAEVAPMTTDEARLRLKDGVMNFGPWADFRDFQDYTFSKILRDGAEHIRQFHPNAKVGITGALGPFAFGGWDWSRLSQSLDVVECYDIGGARALWRDLAPGKPALATLPLAVSETLAPETPRAIWSLALDGGQRGVVLWDDTTAGGRALFDDKCRHTPLAEALAPLLKALDGDIGALLSNSTRAHDGVAVLYSPASVRLHWLFEANHLHGDKWLQAWGADSGAERRESPQLRLRESWGKLLDDLGLGWRFISSAQLERREILRPEAQIKTLVLPRAIALSDREVEALKEFAAAGGRIVADACCGRFDEHGRARSKPALDELFQVDTSTEPFIAQAMNPLESAHGPEGQAAPPHLSAGNLKQLVVFSDQPKLHDKGGAGIEYRRSPVLAASKAGVYLNLDLTDYLRWRLHPDQPRAAAVREVIGGIAFADRLAQGLIDWKATRLPVGTQLIWLQPRSSATRILALRRNPQERLHELGTEAEGNWAFEKAEPFSLALRAPSYVAALPTPGQAGQPDPQIPGGATQKIEGTLDPVTPLLLTINAAPPKPPKVTAPASIRLGKTLEIGVASGVEGRASLFSVRLIAPDSSERAYHALTRYVPDGVLAHRAPLAYNEPPGAWKVAVRDLVNGGETVVNVEVTGERVDNMR